MTKRRLLIVLGAAAIFLGVWPQPAEMQRTTTPRQMWEYRSISIVRASQTGAPFTIWNEVSPDGTAKELPLPVNVPARAKQLGEEGWELVSIVPISNNVCGGGATNASSCAGFTSQIMYWFKRPK